MRHLLIYQLVIVNLIGACGIVAGWPYVVTVFEADSSHISLAIVALWAFGIASCFIRGFKVSRMLDASKTLLKPYDLLSLRYKANKAEAKNDHIAKIATWLAMLGMFGTVVGLISMAMSLKDVAGDISNLTAAIAQAFEGYGVALATTAVGLVAGLWVEVNALFITTATSCLEQDVSE